MEPFLNPAVGDTVYVMREDRGGQMDIPLNDRTYINNEYGYWAKIIKLNPEKWYHRVKPLTNETLKTRKASKAKIYRPPQA